MYQYESLSREPKKHEKMKNERIGYLV
jgi:hypothetical protein